MFLLFLFPRCFAECSSSGDGLDTSVAAVVQQKTHGVPCFIMKFGPGIGTDEMYIRVFPKNRGNTSKMDGEHNGKTLLNNTWFGGCYFGNTHTTQVFQVVRFAWYEIFQFSTGEMPMWRWRLWQLQRLFRRFLVKRQLTHPRNFPMISLGHWDPLGFFGCRENIGNYKTEDSGSSHP